MQNFFLNQRIVKFAAVGAAGFIVDLAVFSSLFYWLQAPLITARIFAFIAAATATYIGNRLITFEDKSTGKLRQYIKYFAVASFSAIPNLLVFRGLTIMLGEGELAIGLAFILGILAGMMFNYILSRRFVFRVA